MEEDKSVHVWKKDNVLGLHHNKLIYFYTHIICIYVQTFSFLAIHFSLNIQNMQLKIIQTTRLYAFTTKETYKKLKCNHTDDSTSDYSSF